MPSRRPSFKDRPAITPARISEAALAIVRESGYGALSMRSVAQRLDTGQASLYVHVRNKAELDRLIVEAVLSQEFEAAADQPWRERLRAEAGKFLRVMASYPGLALAQFASAPRTTSFFDDYESRLALHCSRGLDARQAVAADTVLNLFLAARSIEDATIQARIAESGLSPEIWWERLREAATAPSLEVDALADEHSPYPLLNELNGLLGPEFRAWVASEAVELILDGIEARYLRRGHGHERTAPVANVQ